MVVVASGSAVSVAANSTSADQITGTYQFIPFEGNLSIFAKSSATGMKLRTVVDGVVQCNDLDITYTGTAGTLSQQDNYITSVPVYPGQRVEFFLRNSTAGALTTDYILVLE